MPDISYITFQLSHYSVRNVESHFKAAKAASHFSHGI